MIKLKNNQYGIVKDIVISTDFELSVKSVIAGNNPGEIYVDSLEYPRSVLFKTSECNLVAGYAYNNEFNNFIKDIFNFWDMVTCDTKEWEKQIECIHPNKYIKKVYKRFLRLSRNALKTVQSNNPEYRPERITSELLKCKDLTNMDKVEEWINDNWFSVENFLMNGVGYCIKNDNRIISWSIMDCYFSKSTEIGIFTDEDYKGRGYGSITAAATVQACFDMDFNQIGWHCVITNKGSYRIAEKMGFTEEKQYSLFSPFPPIENDTDLNTKEWSEWAIYYDEIYNEEPAYIWLTAECWAKAGNIDKTIDVCKSIIDLSIITNKELFDYLHDNYFFSKFLSETKWKEFICLIQ